MKKRAQKVTDVDPFAPVRAAFERMVAWADGTRCPDDHAELERELEIRGREVHRLMFQARLDRMFAEEAERMQRRPPAGRLRVRGRFLETIFGRVRVRRYGVRRVGQQSSRFGLDRRLRLPGELYSMGLRRHVAEETRSQSWDRAVARLDTTTGGHVPKRQAEQLVERAAQDFDEFYAERGQREPVNDTTGAETLLVLSCDGKGIAMRPEALREATRKQADEATRGQVRGDPTEVRPERRFSKRMATVTAVWDQVPCERTADDIVRKLRPDGERVAHTLPRPERKRVAASIEKNLAAGIAEMFDEADRRDPNKERPCVALVDGDEDQKDQIERQAARRGRPITIVLDLLHVLHYIWLAGMAIRRGNSKEAEAWVSRYLHKLLTAANPLDIIAGIHQAATLASLTSDERAPVERCVGYLRSNISYILYPQYLTAGLPIATGVIEGACRHLVQDRMGITGARWGIKSAEAVLRLRALATNGDWNEYWRFHSRKESERCEARAA